MGRGSRPGRLAGAVAVALTALSAASGAAMASAANGPGPADGPGPAAATSFTVPGELDAVAATSASSAWAVGFAENKNPAKPDALIVAHWDGARWKRMTIAGFPYGRLYAVTAVSKNDVWAVGENESTVPGYNRPPFGLVLHWNGTAWRPVPLAFGITGIPTAVTATAKDVWVAVSADEDESLHETGGRWYVVPVTQPGNLENPLSVVMSGPRQGWLAGTVQPAVGSAYTAFAMRWNGAAWRHVPVKVHDAFSEIVAMAGLPGGDVWAVGTKALDPYNGNTFGPLTLRWDGKAWREVPFSIAGAYELNGVAHIPGGTAWAVGTMANNGVNGALAARWTGTAWKLAPSPAADNADFLFGVTATSASDAWAVGERWLPSNTATVTVVLHWNGKAWS